MQQETIHQPTVTYILLVADFFSEGVARDTSAVDAFAQSPSPWSPPTPRRRAR